ncbi:MAG: shikimate kinase [Candidatus Obscuribacterales bacterium]|nr:shikimate kinase [Candidatus Obscuribacterales bacterium]
MTVRRHLILVGPSASGKTSLSRALARDYKLRQLDTDDMIKSRAGMSIAQIFDRFGESHFRKLEADILNLLETTHFDAPVVVATGGGLPIAPGNMDRLKNLGCTIYLFASPKTLAERIQLEIGEEISKKMDLGSQGKRPMLAQAVQGEGFDDAKKLTARIQTLLSNRRTIYEQAEISLDTEGKNLEEARADLKALLADKHLC